MRRVGILSMIPVFVAIGMSSLPATNATRPTSLPPRELVPDQFAIIRLSQTSPHAYQIGWFSINSGGLIGAVSPYHRMGYSVGQSVAGEAASAGYRMSMGFWYGAGVAACACDCLADPACDGVTDVLDVINTVNVAFRGFPSILDPNVACPYGTTDVDCSTATDVIDVVKMVNVAFRGANPATEFCHPCP
jgi:hypothetical protein